MNKEEQLVRILIEKKYHISFSESCTGGMCASRLINVANASMVLNESFVTYSNESKIKYLNVSKNTIDKYGVSSKEVAYEMAKGVAINTNSNVGVGVTGVAGPSSDGINPVGYVCFGFYINGDIHTYDVNFNDIGRNNVRMKACDFVFDKLIELLR